MKIEVIQSLEISEKEENRIFLEHLEELTVGWYIAKSNGILGREIRQWNPTSTYDSKGRWVLCHESDPHPHNGDTHRELERSLEHPDMQIIRYAVELRTALKNRDQVIREAKK